MSPTSLTSDEQSVLREVRELGSLTLLPQTRGFAHAESLQRKGLLRAVALRGVPSATFLLSGDGIAMVGRPTGPEL